MPNSAVPDHLVRPIYSFSEADSLAGATRGTASRWIRGYHYTRDSKRVDQPPVSVVAGDLAAASFLDLLEVVVIARMKRVGFSLGQVRQIVINCRQLLDLQRPLVQARFKTDGQQIFVEQGDKLIEVGRRKRMTAWSEILAPFLQELDYAGEWADRWWPLGRENLIVVDPEYGFGQPVIEGTGVRTEMILERVRAGELPAEIAEDFNVTPTEVHRAIQYEAIRQAA